MPIHFDTAFSFDDPSVKAFLFDGSAASYTAKPPQPAGFGHDSQDRRPSGEPVTAIQDIVFLVQEWWQLLQAGSGAGVHRVVVAMEQRVELSVSYWAFFRDGLSEAAIAEGRALLASYDPASDGNDVEAWVQARIGPNLQLDDFVLDTAVTLRKIDQPQERDISQRDALFALLGVGGGEPPHSEIPVVGDYSLPQWGHDHQLDLVLIRTAVLQEDSAPPLDPTTGKEVAPGHATDPMEVGRAIDDVLGQVVPSSCGQMEREQFGLLALAAWPEFKISWTRIRIRIGCSSISISVPMLHVRLSKLVFYVYYSLPRNLGRTVFKIAETCAIRSALGSAVIGIVTTNIAAAVGSFTPLFERCLEREVVNCIHPGLMLLKEPGDWVPPD